MKVETYLFGGVEVNPEQIINFPDGIAAFENNKRFMLIHEADKGEPVSFTLQSLDDSNVAFQIIDPASVGFNYELALTDEESAKLQSPKSDDVAVMLILYTRQEAGERSLAANFRAPLIINTQARIGLQKMIGNPRPNITISNLSSAV